MKYPLSFLFLFSFVIFSRAQNILPNSNFAVRNPCSIYGDVLLDCHDWFNPTAGSPDYFDSCTVSGTTTFGVPVNSMGYQTSFANAYTGIFTFGGSGDLNYREYIADSFPSLISGATYKVTIQISMADSSWYATDGFGVYFYTNIKPDKTSDRIIAFAPQIDYSKYGIISDKTNWVTLVDTFVAYSAYTHLAVGCFKPDSILNKTLMTGLVDRSHAYMAYYYIDSVAVEEIQGPTGIPVTCNIKGTLYPNPFKDRATLDIENSIDNNYELSVFNLQGILVRKVENIMSNEITINRNDLNPGFYYYQVRSSNNVLLNGKMIIQ